MAEPAPAATVAASRAVLAFMLPDADPASRRRAAITFLQCSFRRWRERIRFLNAKAAVEVCTTLAPTGSDGVLVKRTDQRRHVDTLNKRKTVITREIEQLQQYQYYQKSGKQKEIRRRVKVLRTTVRDIEAELLFLRKKADALERSSLAKRSTTVGALPPDHVAHITAKRDADATYQKHEADEAVDFWLAMNSARSAMHHDWQELDGMGLDYRADDKTVVIDVRLSTKPFADGSGGGGAPASDVAAIAVPYRLSLSREGSRGGSRATSRPQSQQGLRGGPPPPPTSSGSWAAAAAAAAHVYVQLGPRPPGSCEAGSFVRKSSGVGRSAVKVHAVHSGDETMRRQLAMCMLLSAGMVDVSSIRIKAIRADKEEVRLLRMQRQLAITAREASAADPARDAALQRYIEMIDYVTSMYTYKIRLSWVALLRRGCRAAVPGFGYRPTERAAAVTLQRHYRGYRVRCTFDWLQAIMIQFREQQLRLRLASEEAKARYQQAMTLAVTARAMRDMDTQTACAIIIQRQLRYLWCARSIHAEKRKRKLAADQIQAMWRAKRVEVRRKEQQRRLQGREQSYAQALKEHRKALRRQKWAAKEGQEAHHQRPLQPHPPPARPSGTRRGGGGMVRGVVGGGPPGGGTAASTVSVGGSTAPRGQASSRRPGPVPPPPPLPPPPPPPLPPELVLPGQGGDVHAKLLAAAISRLKGDGPSRKMLIELRSFTRPPPPVRRVLECTSVLLGAPPDWDSAKLQLADPTYMTERLRGIGQDGALPASRVALARKYVAQQPDFSAEELDRVCGAVPGAKWLCEWCKAVVVASEEADRRSTLWLPKSAKSALAAAPGPGPPGPPGPWLPGSGPGNAASASASPRKLPPLSATAPAGGGAPAAVPEWGGEAGAPASAADPAAPPSGGSPSGAASARTLRPHPPDASLAPPPWQTARPSLGASSRRPPRKPKTRHLHSIRPFLKLAASGFPDKTDKKAPEGAEGGAGKQGASASADGAWLSATLTAATRARAGAMGAWVQTRAALDAAGEEQAAALRAMLDGLSAEGGSASEAIALARRAAEPPPSATAEREPVKLRQVFKLKRAALLAGVEGGRNRTAAIASLWADGGFLASHRKHERAALAQWRTKRHAWSRAAGLRRQLVLAIADREQWREAKATEEESGREQRHFLWKIEDNAAVAIQEFWRERKRQREESTKTHVTEQFQLAGHSAALAGDERAQLLEKSLIAEGRRKRAQARKRSSPSPVRMSSPQLHAQAEPLGAQLHAQLELERAERRAEERLILFLLQKHF